MKKQFIIDLVILLALAFVLGYVVFIFKMV